MELISEIFYPLLLAAIYFFYPENVDPSLKPRDVPQTELKKEYDFIIVGAGSAGCVVAHRLSEIPYWTVLLIESGDDETSETDIPLFYYKLPGTIYDWNYTTVPQENACLATGGKCAYPRGHVMGGTSNLNGMMYVRGNRKDYDLWAELGNKGWSYKEVLPYFIKAENITIPHLMNSPYHGTDGPLNVQYATYKTPISGEYIKAGVELGWIHRDYNGRYQENSVDYSQNNMNGPSRESTSKAYLNPIRNRRNLLVIKKSFVLKLLIDESKRIVTGVEYVRDDVICKIYARKEVILSAGFINTAKLLMLSGIGPKKELTKHGIKVLRDLPVGENYLDHIGVTPYFQVEKDVTITSNVWKTGESIFEYTVKRDGPLSSLVEAAAFVNLNNPKEPPHTSFIFTSFAPEYKHEQHIPLFIIYVYVIAPKSVGTVTLSSSDPYDPPLIDPKLFSDPSDYPLLVRAMETAFKYIKTPTMKKYATKLFTGAHPLCTGLSEKDFIKCFLRQYSFAFYHGVGTAKMGIDNKAVISPELLVSGIKNLRVIDASIMPTIPRGNMHAPVIMIAEKGSDIIKRHYKAANK